MSVTSSTASARLNEEEASKAHSHILSPCKLYCPADLNTVELSPSKLTMLQRWSVSSVSTSEHDDMDCDDGVFSDDKVLLVELFKVVNMSHATYT